MAASISGLCKTGCMIFGGAGEHDICMTVVVFQPSPTQQCELCEQSQGLVDLKQTVTGMGQFGNTIFREALEF